VVEARVYVTARHARPPAIVATGQDQVEFVIAVRAVLGGEHPAAEWVEVEIEAVAQAVSVDGLDGHRRVRAERVVRWGGQGRSRLEAVNLAAHVAEVLGVARRGVLADGDIEHAVGPEVHIAAVVVAGAINR